MRKKGKGIRRATSLNLFVAFLEYPCCHFVSTSQSTFKVGNILRWDALPNISDILILPLHEMMIAA